MFTVYGHRGLPSQAPENTIASFKSASKAEGINWIELDVTITDDEQLVIIHDDYLDRTTNMSGEVTSYKYSDIKSASAGAWYSNKFKDEHLPTFDDVINFANDYNMNLNVELKGVTGPKGTALSKSMVQQVSDKLQNLNNDQQILISSFNVMLVKLAEELMPQFKRAVIFKAAAFGEDWRTILDFCNSKTVNIEDKSLTQAKVKTIKEAGYELNVWTVNKVVRANQLANWGVDGVFTDNADKLSHLQEV